MPNIDNLVQDFLVQKVVAVVGVSDKRDTGANRITKHSSNMAIASMQSIRAYLVLMARPVILI